MKICPACKTRYSDDTLRFCLQDGTPLAHSLEGETPTVVLAETETVAARRGDPGLSSMSDPGSAAWQHSQVTHVATQGAEKKSSNTTVAVAATAVGMLLLFAIAGVGAFLVFKSSGGIGNSEPPKNVNTSNSLATISPTPMSSPTATRTASPSPTSTPDATPTPQRPRASYPSTSRLKFARGAYTTSFSGELNPGDSRSLVLACRAGQSLSASITSGGSCISIRGGGGSMRTTTSGGDNYVTVANGCSGVVRFSITISVI